MNRRFVAGIALATMMTGAVAPLAAAAPEKTITNSPQETYSLEEDGPVHLGGKDGKPKNIPDRHFWSGLVFTYDEPTNDEWQTWFSRNEDTKVTKAKPGKKGLDRYLAVSKNPTPEHGNPVNVLVFDRIDLDKVPEYQRYLDNGGEPAPEGAHAFTFGGFHNVSEGEAQEVVTWYKKNSGRYKESSGGSEKGKSESEGEKESRSPNSRLNDEGLVYLGGDGVQPVPSEYSPDGIDIYVAYDFPPGKGEDGYFTFEKSKPLSVKEDEGSFFSAHKVGDSYHAILWDEVHPDSAAEYKEHLKERGRDFPDMKIFRVVEVMEGTQAQVEKFIDAQ